MLNEEVEMNDPQEYADWLAEYGDYYNDENG
mgnify:CR=1 FL=1